MKVYVCEGCGLVADPQNLNGSWRFDSKVPGLIEHAHGGIRYCCKATEVVSVDAIVEAIQPGGTKTGKSADAVEAAHWAVGRIGQLTDRLSETIGRETALKKRVRRLEEALRLSPGGIVTGWSPEHFPGEPPKPPVGHVPYLPTHNHPDLRECWTGCPVFDYEDYKKSHGDPFEALAERTTQRNDALVALADIRAAAHNSWISTLSSERVIQRVDEVFDGLARELPGYIGALRLRRSWGGS